MGLTAFMTRNGVLHCAALGAVSHVGRFTNRMDADDMWVMPSLVAVATNHPLFGDLGQYGPPTYHKWILSQDETQVRVQ